MPVTNNGPSVQQPAMVVDLAGHATSNVELAGSVLSILVHHAPAVDLPVLELAHVPVSVDPNVSSGAMPRVPARD